MIELRASYRQKPDFERNAIPIKEQSQAQALREAERMHQEKELIAALRSTLLPLYEPSKFTYAVRDPTTAKAAGASKSPGKPKGGGKPKEVAVADAPGS